MKSPVILSVIPFKGEIDLVYEASKSMVMSYVAGFTHIPILWDNGSTNCELNKLWNATPKVIIIIKHNIDEHSKMIYEIINTAKNDSRCSYLLLCDGIKRFKIQTFHNLVKTCMSSSNIAAVGCKVLNYNTNFISGTGARLEDGKIIEPYAGMEKTDSKNISIERRLWLDRSCVLYNLDILRRHDLNIDLSFSPEYFEGEDLMTRLNVFGYSVLYDPLAVVENSTKIDKEIFSQNKEKYMRKWERFFKYKQLNF